MKTMKVLALCFSRHGHMSPINYTSQGMTWRQMECSVTVHGAGSHMGCFECTVHMQEFVGDRDPVRKKLLLENVRKLIEAASDKSLAETCLGRLTLPLNDDVLRDAPHLSPTMVALWRVYRESRPEVLSALNCTDPIFRSHVTLPQLLKWAAEHGADSTSVPNDRHGRSKVLQRHLTMATAHALAHDVPSTAEQSVVALWGGWFAALVPDMDTPLALPMRAYAILASSARRSAPEWPRLVQVRVP